MQALPGTLSCGCCDCRYGHDRWALRTRLTCSIRLRISAGTHMRTENVAAFEKNCFFSAQSATIGIYRIQREESSHAKTATVPSNLWRTTGRYILSQRVREYRADPADAGRIRGHSAGWLGAANPRAVCRSNGHFPLYRAGDLRKCTAQDRSVSCPRETAAHHRGKLPHLRRTGGSSLRPLLPDAESQHGKIRQNLQRRFHYENCSCLWKRSNLSALRSHRAVQALWSFGRQNHS